MTALVAGRELGREIGATVIHNLITSRAVPELIVERGGTALRARVGHSYIKALMAESGAIFGGEHSAHYYFRDFWGADSGMLAALHVLAALGEQDRPLSEMMADYQRYVESGEINFTVADAPACVDAVLKSFGSRIQSDWRAVCCGAGFKVLNFMADDLLPLRHPRYPLKNSL